MNQLGELPLVYKMTDGLQWFDIADGYTMASVHNEALLVLAPVAWWQTNYPDAKRGSVWHGVILFTQPADIPAALFGRLVRFGARELLASPWQTGAYAYNVRHAGTRDNGRVAYVVSALWSLSRFQSDVFSETIQNWIDSQFVTSPWDDTAYPLEEVATAFTNLTAVQGTAYPAVSIGVFGNPLTWDTAYTDSVALCEAFVSAHAELSPPT